MNIMDLPLPLRLRNSLVKAGFTDDTGLRDWLNGAGHADVEDGVIPGIGATGMRQLEAWLTEVNHAPRETASEPTTKPAAGPEVIRRRLKATDVVAAGASKPADTRDLDADASIYRRDDVVTHGRWGQMADVAMRGGLESLRDAKIDHQREAVIPEDAYWTPARSPTAELTARAVSMRAEAARLGAETVVSTSKDTLTLRLESDLQTQIAQMIPLIKGLAHVKELGVEVSRETVARMALIRGLDALERQYKGKNDAKTDENPPETATEAPISAAEPKNGVHATPEGWTRAGSGDKIPVAQAVIHDYYTQNNWFRYWGKAGDSIIHFYWSPEVQFQDLDVFPGSDKNGKTIAVQDTPWGPGHIIPLNWANQ